MLDRVIGAIPRDRLRIEHRLVRIEKLRMGGYELHFETNEGRRRYKALNVICTLPYAVLKDIEGIDEFQIGTSLMKPIVSHQAKVIYTFQERFWRKRWDQGRLLGPQPLWESTYRVQELLENPWGLVSQLYSGEKAINPDANLIQQGLENLKILEKMSSLPLIEAQMQSFSNSRWAGARGSYPTLSQAEKVFEKTEGTWLWAGEHAAGDLCGTWAGALESGGRAAQTILGRNVFSTERV